MVLRNVVAFVLSVFVLLSGVAPGLAEETGAGDGQKAKAAPGEQWRFAIIPYAGLVGMNGTVGTGHQTARVDLSYSDFSRDSKAAAAIGLEARKGKHSIGFEGYYVKLNDDTYLQGVSSPTVADATLEMTKFQLDYTYRFFERPWFTLGAQAGLRYWNITSKLELSGPVAGYAQRYSGTANWVDPIVGLNATFRVNERLSFPLRADIGGFDIGSRLTSKGSAGVNYMVRSNVAAELGYGYTYVDYRQGGSVFDVTMAGPYLAVAFIY